MTELQANRGARAVATATGIAFRPAPWRTASRRRRPANVYRWAATGADPNVQQLGALVSRVGPGTGGDAAFSALDPQLERPYVNELTFGFESRPDDRTIVRMMAIVRHEGQLVGVVNTGVPTSSYAAVHADRPGRRSRRRPDADRVQPAACRLRRGSLSADEPGRASRHVCRRRHHRPKHGRPVVADRRRHGGPIGDDVGEPRLPGIRKRSRAHRRGVHGSERGDQRARPPVHRARLHDQDGRRVSFLGDRPARRLGALPGRPALRAPDHRAGSQPGRSKRSGRS